MNNVTIIITTWNSLDMLKMCLNFLEKYTPRGYKIVVVNNGSSDGTKKFLENRKDITPIHNSKNLGVVKALDQAEKLVSTKYFVSLSDDVLVSKNWLKNLLNVYESDPLIKTVAPIKPSSKIKYPYSNKSSREEWDRLQLVYQNKLSKSMILDKYSKGNYDRFVEDMKAICDFGNLELQCPFNFVSGCCVLVETEYMKNIGGFSDTKFHIYGGEDVDRCWRIGKDGYKVVQTSHVFVHHFEGVSLKKNKLNWKKHVKKNNQLLVKKWEGDFWNRLEKYTEKYGSISSVIEKYWIIEWLLESLNKKAIPKNMQGLITGYLMTKSESRLKLS